MRFPFIKSAILFSLLICGVSFAVSDGSKKPSKVADLVKNQHKARQLIVREFESNNSLRLLGKHSVKQFLDELKQAKLSYTRGPLVTTERNSPPKPILRNGKKSVSVLTDDRVISALVAKKTQDSIKQLFKGYGRGSTMLGKKNYHIKLNIDCCKKIPNLEWRAAMLVWIFMGIPGNYDSDTTVAVTSHFLEKGLSRMGKIRLRNLRD